MQAKCVRAHGEAMNRVRLMRLLFAAVAIAMLLGKGHGIGFSDGGYW